MTGTRPVPDGLRSRGCRCQGREWRGAPSLAFLVVGAVLPRDAGVVRRVVPRAHRGAGRRLGRDRRRPQRPGRGAHRVRQDAGGVPVVDRPAGQRAAARRAAAPLPGPLRLPAEGARRRRRAQPARTAGRHPARRHPARPPRARPHRRRPLGRHPGRRAPPVRPNPARHPHHHAGVALPAADQPGPRVAARRRDRDRRRGARGRRHQARRPPRAVARAARRTCSSSRRSASGCRPPSARSRRSPGSSAARTTSRSCSRRRQKTVELEVVVPVEDLGELGQTTGEVSGSAAGEERRTSIWPHVEERIVDLVEAHRSTIVFANSRRLAERLCARLNEIHEERVTGARLPEPGDVPAGTGDGAVRRLARRGARAGPRPPRLGVQGAARR